MSEDLQVKEIENSSDIKPESLIKSFADGFDGVMILAFTRADDKDPDLNKLTLKRTSIIKGLLENIGIDPGRLRLDILSDHDAHRPNGLISEFVDHVSGLGPNPIGKEQGAGSINITDLEGQKHLTYRHRTELTEKENDARELISDLISNGEVSAVYGLENHHGHIVPGLFNGTEGLDTLVLEPRYMMSKDARMLQTSLPDGILGVMVRACDERAFIEMGKRNMINPKRFRMIGVACSEYDAVNCKCNRPNPKNLEIGKPLDIQNLLRNKDLRVTIDNINSMKINEKFQFWNYQFSKCIKCYGCRDACVFCACKICTLEKSNWVKRGRIPPEFPTFHMIRMYHMVDKCVGCCECESACPMEIPLQVIQQKTIEDMRKLFDYTAGEDPDQPPPLRTVEHYNTKKGVL